MSEKKRIILLGATGSIGDNTVRVIAQNPDRLELVGMACQSRYRELAAIAHRFGVKYAAVFDENAAAEARQSGLFPPKTEILSGLSGLIELASLPEGDILLSAVVGTLGLQPTLAAIRTGKDIALASKEILVLAGKFVTEAAQLHQSRIIPVDSEHNAIFQCLQGHPREQLLRLIVTASGGPFLEWPLEDLALVTPREALQHPTWAMGPKVTVDSATMANKGLELIEAGWLFGLTTDRIEVAVHPQSIVHSMVEFVDGSVISQWSPTSMTFPIQHALLYPERQPGVERGLDFSRPMNLEFRPVEAARYPCLQLAREAMQAGGVAPAIFNAANEIAVEAFLANRLTFLEIPALIRNTLDHSHHFEPDSLDEILEADASARRQAARFVTAHA
jgi:1-deoxy-D-xylulose-5-phosphate reductoisomerase